VAVLLVVVSRSEPSRVTYLTHVFANKTVDVVLDRRVEERRRGWLGGRAAAKRRHGDRRQHDITKDLQTYGWAVARRQR